MVLKVFLKVMYGVKGFRKGHAWRLRFSSRSCMALKVFIKVMHGVKGFRQGVMHDVKGFRQGHA
jgi:hypothetical protein